MRLSSILDRHSSGFRLRSICALRAPGLGGLEITANRRRFGRGSRAYEPEIAPTGRLCGWLEQVYGAPSQTVCHQLSCKRFLRHSKLPCKLFQPAIRANWFRSIVVFRSRYPAYPRSTGRSRWSFSVSVAHTLNSLFGAAVAYPAFGTATGSAIHPSIGSIP